MSSGTSRKSFSVSSEQSRLKRLTSSEIFQLDSSRTTTTQSVPSLERFVQQTTPHYKRPYHLRKLTRLLTRIARGESVRVVVHTPPRHAKTETLLHFISWFLRQHPNLRVGYCSYNEKIAFAKSDAAIRIADRAGLKLRTRTKGEWLTPEDGGCFATGIGGTATGYGFRVGIVDDPVKNRADAESATKRNTAWDWFTDTFMRRLDPNGSVILNMARWHPDDLAGRVIQRWGWEYVCLPAITTDEDGNEHALWPEQWPLELMQQRRRESGVYTWESLEMGNPRPRGGSVFGEPKMYKRKDLPRRYTTAIGVDLAYTSSTSADYSVAVVGKQDMVKGPEGTRKVYITESHRKQVRAPVFAGVLKSLRARFHKARMRWYASGTEKGSADFIKVMGVPMDVRKPNGDKFTRAIPYAAAWNRGDVLLPEFEDEETHDANGDRLFLPDTDWVSTYILEHSNFTGVDDANDDQVDAGAAMYDQLNGVNEGLSTLRALATQ